MPQVGTAVDRNVSANPKKDGSVTIDDGAFMIKWGPVSGGGFVASASWGGWTFDYLFVVSGVDRFDRGVVDTSDGFVLLILRCSVCMLLIWKMLMKKKRFSFRLCACIYTVRRRKCALWLAPPSNRSNTENPYSGSLVSCVFRVWFLVASNVLPLSNVWNSDFVWDVLALIKAVTMYKLEI